MAVLEVLDYWFDEVARTGVINMSVDQLLTERIGRIPMLRVYQWSEPTVSLGYFLALKDAQKAFPAHGSHQLQYVRRWTGGGIVDHRIDLTYTLVIPREHALASARGAESYRVIHQALAESLNKLGVEACLTSEAEGDGGLACFSNPVAYDITAPSGLKLAGAGQRRTRYGLLHQGSVVAAVTANSLGEKLASCLSNRVNGWQPKAALISDADTLSKERYGTSAWLMKR